MAPDLNHCPQITCHMSFSLPYSEGSNPMFFTLKVEETVVREKESRELDPLRLLIQHSWGYLFGCTFFTYSGRFSIVLTRLLVYSLRPLPRRGPFRNFTDLGIRCETNDMTLSETWSPWSLRWKSKY